MTAQLQITIDRDLQLFAAIELSEALTKMELRHAFIGGFALAPWGLHIRICITSYQSPGL